MSVIVEDLLKMPSMRNAKVLGGKEGLKNVVYGVTVLEYSYADDIQDEFYRKNAGLLNSQIVLTSFAPIKDNVCAQMTNLRRLAKAGQTAVVLYYVGFVMKSVDPRLVSLADELGLPLIVMPENRMDIRFSDLISEVSEAVLVDRMHYKGSLVTEIIGQITKLPTDKQTVDSALSMLCNKLHVSIVLTDGSLNTLGVSPWPLQNNGIESLMTEENVCHHVKRRKNFAPIPGAYIWYAPIHDKGKDPMRLFLIEEGSILNEALVDMAKETVQLAVELWSNQHSAVMTSELVKAILNDEPIRMRRLSEVLHIDIKSIHTSWFLRRVDAGGVFTKDMISTVRKVMDRLDSDIILEPYRSPIGDNEDLIMFFRNPLDLHLLDSCAQEIIDSLHDMGCKQVYLTMLDYKFTTADVRNAFSLWNEVEATARVAFPRLEVFHESEIELVRQCNEIIKLGEKSIASATGCLDALSDRQSSHEFLKTLEVYFLDSDMNMQRASEILGVHKNTIKYRINMVSDALGYSVTNPITTSRLTIALCIRRLLDRASETAFDR